MVKTREHFLRIVFLYHVRVYETFNFIVNVLHKFPMNSLTTIPAHNFNGQHKWSLSGAVCNTKFGIRNYVERV